MKANLNPVSTSHLMIKYTRKPCLDFVFLTYQDHTQGLQMSPGSYSNSSNYIRYIGCGIGRFQTENEVKMDMKDIRKTTAFEM